MFYMTYYQHLFQLARALTNPTYCCGCWPIILSENSPSTCVSCPAQTNCIQNASSLSCKLHLASECVCDYIASWLHLYCFCFFCGKRHPLLNRRKQPQSSRQEMLFGPFPPMNLLQNTVPAVRRKQTTCRAVCMLYKVEVDPTAFAMQSRRHLLSHYIEYAVTCITEHLRVLFERFSLGRSSKPCGFNYTCV